MRRRELFQATAYAIITPAWCSVDEMRCARFELPKVISRDDRFTRRFCHLESTVTSRITTVDADPGWCWRDMIAHNDV
jgi:hypothetical protein